MEKQKLSDPEEKNKKRAALEDAVKSRQQGLLGKRYVGVSLGTLRTPEWAQVKISQFMEKKKNFLVYIGNPGIGKTYLCAALIEWAITNFNHFRYWCEADLLQRVRDSMDEVKGDYLKTLKYLIDDDLIFLDDIGSTGFNDWRLEVLFAAIDERYNSEMPTVLTSNYSKAQMEKIFHPRLVSRIFAQENTIIEILDGEDFRNPQDPQSTKQIRNEVSV